MLKAFCNIRKKINQQLIFYEFISIVIGKEFFHIKKEGERKRKFYVKI